MFTALLVIIYVSFISLGLPDSPAGLAWPAIQKAWGAPLPLCGGHLHDRLLRHGDLQA